MIKFLKKYWTHIVNILFFVSYIVIFFYYGALALDEINLVSGLFLVLVFVLVIAIWGEIIYYIVYVAKNRELEKRGLKVALIYLFNAYYIPCFKLKYVDKDEKYNIKNIIYVVISIILTIVMVFSVFQFSYGELYSDTYKTYVSADNVVEFTLPSNYVSKTVGEYDLYFSKGIKVNMGVFLYDDWGYTAEEILDSQESYFINTRENMKLLDSTTRQVDNKVIITHTYKGDTGNTSNVYNLSVITFSDKDDYIIYVVQVSERDYYDNCEEEFNKILDDIDLND